jgi:hypothetical protein
MSCVGEFECGLGDPGFLEFVDVSVEEGEGNGTGGVDAGVFEFALDEERDGDETAGGGLGEVAGPLVDADGADDLFGLGDLVHLGPGGEPGEEDYAEGDALEDVSHRPVIEIRRYLLAKVLWPVRTVRICSLPCRV